MKPESSTEPTSAPAAPAPLVTIGHKLPHRVRFAAPRLAWHRDACECVGRAVSEQQGVVRVTVHPATGSVIVEGDALIDAAPLAARLAALVHDACDEQGRRLADLGPDDHPGPTRVARAVAKAVAAINADVRAALDHRADLGTILPVVFAIAGLSEVAVAHEMPVPRWFNLLWWSLRSFMTFNIRAVEEQVDAGEEHAGEHHTNLGAEL